MLNRKFKTKTILFWHRYLKKPKWTTNGILIIIHSPPFKSQTFFLVYGTFEVEDGERGNNYLSLICEKKLWGKNSAKCHEWPRFSQKQLAQKGGGLQILQIYCEKKYFFSQCFLLTIKKNEKQRQAVSQRLLAKTLRCASVGLICITCLPQVAPSPAPGVTEAIRSRCYTPEDLRR